MINRWKLAHASENMERSNKFQGGSRRPVWHGPSKARQTGREKQAAKPRWGLDSRRPETYCEAIFRILLLSVA